MRKAAAGADHTGASQYMASNKQLSRFVLPLMILRLQRHARTARPD